MKRILVVVDYQNDFVNGAIPCGQSAVDIDKRISDKICKYVLKQDDILFTKDCHQSDIYKMTRESRQFPIHCVPNTPGFELYGTAAMMTNVTHSSIIVKNSDRNDMLTATIKRIMDTDEIELIELIGIPTHIGVLQYSMVLQYTFPSIPVWVDPKCCASWDKEKHQQALSFLEDMGIGVGYA